MARKKVAQKKEQPFIPFTNVTRREQYLIVLLGITVVFATFYFSVLRHTQAATVEASMSAE